jgi:hypothetical protein
MLVKRRSSPRSPALALVALLHQDFEMTALFGGQGREPLDLAR